MLTLTFNGGPAGSSFGYNSDRRTPDKSFPVSNNVAFGANGGSNFTSKYGTCSGSTYFTFYSNSPLSFNMNVYRNDSSINLDVCKVGSTILMSLV